MTNSNIIGLDLAKNVIQICKIDKHDELISNKAISPVKSEERQSLQTLESSRQFLTKEITALNNHIRAYLYEYGITISKGRKSLTHLSI